MGFQISPGINVSEVDLTTIVPAVGTTVGAIAGPFRWGPANVPMLIDNEITLANTFGKPDNNTANTWFTGSNFLAYANALQTVRVVKNGTGGHKNSTADGAGLLIVNEDAYLNNYENGQGNVGMFAAKYPGDLGNSIGVSIADVDSFNSWTFKSSFDGAPGTSTLIANAGGENDEMHIVVYDVLGWWTGLAGSVLERFAFVSKCAAAKTEDGTSQYYPDVINRTSKFLWWMDHPTQADLGLNVSPNWGSVDLTVSFNTTSEKVLLSSVVGTFEVGEVVADAAGATISTGSGAVLGTVVIGDGGIENIPVNAQGSGYTVAPDVIISGDGDGLALAVAVLGTGPNADKVVSVTVTNPGANYTTATATFSSGTGASADATVNTGLGTVTGFTSLVGGTHYVTAPTITVTGDGSNATAHATVSGGAVTGIVIDDPGSGYSTAGFTITPVGTGATASTITFDTGKVLDVPVISGGSGYKGTPTVTFTGGGGTNAAATVTLSNGVVTLITVTNGGSNYATTPTAAVVPQGSGATAVVTVDSTGRVTALTPTAVGSGYPSNPTVTISGPGVGAQVTANVVGNSVTSYTVVSGGSGYETISAKVLEINSSTLTVSPVSGTFEAAMNVQGLDSGATGTVVSVTGGALVAELDGGVDANSSISESDYQVDTLGRPAGYAMFRSGEDIDVSLILGADATATRANYIISVAEYRKDAISLLSPPKSAVVDNSGNEAADIIAFRNQLPSTSYGVMDNNWKYQYDKYNDVYRWVPLNGDIAGLCVRTDVVRDPWWSPAGYNRGIIQNVVRLAWNPRKAYRDQLYQAGINSVMSEPGQGTLLFGDKTMLTKPSAFDRINVRRLFIVLEKAISTAAKYTLFEFNDQFTRSQFVNMVEPFLRDVMGRRGIYDYRVVCDATNNTPEVVDSNRFVGDIYVKPARSINFIQLNFVAVRTGVDFTEIVGKF